MAIAGVGRIIIRCHKCGAVLYRYAIGDKNDRNKFNGPPMPRKALSGFDGLTCPVCGTKLSAAPVEVKFLPVDEFEKLFSETEYYVKLRSSIPVMAPSSTTSVEEEVDEP